MSTTLPASNSYRTPRRSTRINRTVPLTVVGLDCYQAPYREQVSTVSLNCHGCRYSSKHEVLASSWVILELNDEKTQFHKLPDGIFRAWVSQYHSANPNPKAYYEFKRFKETCLSVITIDRNNPGCGVIDRFLADIVTKRHRLRVRLNARSLPQVLSLLLMLGSLRTKAFPMVLAIIETILQSRFGSTQIDPIVEHLDEFLQQLTDKEAENKYLIAWICYFVRANRLEKKFKKKYDFSDPIVRAVYTSRFTTFSSCADFKVFIGVKAVSKKTSMLRHLDVFKPQ